MKTSFTRISGLLAALVFSSLLVGCNAATSQTASEAMETPPPAAPPVAAELSQPGQSPVPAEITQAEPPVIPEVPFDVERPLPENIRARTALAEVVRLTQSGLDEAVLLAFIENAQAGFALGADEIIFLNDIGVPSSVVTAMLNRDKELQLSPYPNVSPAIVTAPPEPSQTTVVAEAAAPSYVHAPAEGTEILSEPAPVSETTFEETLSPYGTWITVEDHGRVWQPTVAVVNPRWRPYADAGRWLSTDRGWYWYSDYSWGWAPFHYGRWFAHPRWGWCWVPGHTWAPSWVTWRFTDGFCGWAPLPPAAVFTSGVGFSWHGSSVGWGFGFGLSSSCFTFVPWNNFCSYRPSRFCLPPGRAQAVYQNSTVVNNIINGNNNTIINGGIPVAEVSRRSRTEIRPVTLRDTVATTTPTRREHLTLDGRSLVVQRPRLSGGATEADRVASTPARSGDSSGVARPIPGRPGMERNVTFAEPRSASSSPARNDYASAKPQVAPDADSVNRPTVSRTADRAGRPTSMVVRGGEAQPATPPTGSMIPPPRAESPAPSGSLVVTGQRPAPARTGTASVWNSANPGTARSESRPTVPERVSAPTPVTAPAAAPVAQPPERIVRAATPTPVAPQRSEVIRVNRSVQNRPAGSPNYTTFSSASPRPVASAPAPAPAAPVARSYSPPAQAASSYSAPASSSAPSSAPARSSINNSRPAPSASSVSAPRAPAPQVRSEPVARPAPTAPATPAPAPTAGRPASPGRPGR